MVRAEATIERTQSLAMHTASSLGLDAIATSHGLLAPEAPQSSNRAELEAVRKALEAYQAMKRAGEADGWREVIIKLDSDYVARCIGDYIWEWERNGFITSKGTPVEHSGVFRELHATIKEIEKDGAVRFWRVGRDFNKEADALANQAFDDAADSGYDDS